MQRYWERSLQNSSLRRLIGFFSGVMVPPNQADGLMKAAV
jgi:hypothetical protein